MSIEDAIFENWVLDYPPKTRVLYWDGETQEWERGRIVGATRFTGQRVLAFRLDKDAPGEDPRMLTVENRDLMMLAPSMN